MQRRKLQAITPKEKSTIEVLSKETDDALLKPKLSFVQFMQQSPLVGVELELNRNHSPMRQRDL